MASRRGLCFSFYFLVLYSISSAILRPSAAVRYRCNPITAVYSFGDSIADTGNLIREGVPVSFSGIANLPYGETTFKKATGRCSDGLLMIDYLALALNLPLLEPSLDKDGNFGHGVNFAVAGATALDKSFFENRGLQFPFTNSSLNVQIKWFKAHLKSICSSFPECKRELGDSLVMLGEIGGNDYNYAFLGGKPLQEVMSYIPLVVKKIIKATKEVIRLGATRVVVPGNFPIGCIPLYLTAFAVPNQDAYDDHNCLISMNNFAMEHNNALMSALEELRTSYPDVLIVYADYYRAFVNILDNAQSFGFDHKSLLKACCGSGGDYNFNITGVCGARQTNLCKNPARRISWDGIHLTQAAYEVMAHELFYGGYSHPNYFSMAMCNSLECCSSNNNNDNNIKSSSSS